VGGGGDMRKLHMSLFSLGHNMCRPIRALCPWDFYFKTYPLWRVGQIAMCSLPPRFSWFINFKYLTRQGFTGLLNVIMQLKIIWQHWHVC